MYAESISQREACSRLRQCPHLRQASLRRKTSCRWQAHPQGQPHLLKEWACWAQSGYEPEPFPVSGLIN